MGRWRRELPHKRSQHVRRNVSEGIPAEQRASDYAPLSSKRGLRGCRLPVRPKSEDARTGYRVIAGSSTHLVLLPSLPLSEAEAST